MISDAIAALLNIVRDFIKIADRRDEEAKRQHDKLARHSADELHAGTDRVRHEPPAV